MPWKCDYCDSYQEDGRILCEVCGAERSRESILEARRVEREERRVRRFGKTFKIADVTGKVLFIGGVCVASLAFVCGLVMLIVSGSFGNMLGSSLSVAVTAFDNVKDLLLCALPRTLQAAASGGGSAVPCNAASIINVMIGNTDESFEIFREICTANAKNAAEKSYIYCMVPLIEGVSAKINALGETVVTVIRHAVETIGNAFRGFF